MIIDLDRHGFLFLWTAGHSFSASFRRRAPLRVGGLIGLLATLRAHPAVRAFAPAMFGGTFVDLANNIIFVCHNGLFRVDPILPPPARRRWSAAALASASAALNDSTASGSGGTT